MPATSQVQGSAQLAGGRRPQAQPRTAQRVNLAPASSSDFKAIADNANGDFWVKERTHPEGASKQEETQRVPARGPTNASSAPRSWSRRRNPRAPGKAGLSA